MSGMDNDDRFAHAALSDTTSEMVVVRLHLGDYTINIIREYFPNHAPSITISLVWIVHTYKRAAD